MTLYANNNALMSKFFATTVQDEAQNWFHTLSPRSIRNFSEFSLVFTKEYSSHCSIKKKFNHFFNMKNDPNESLRTYVKRFKLCKDVEPTQKKVSDKLLNDKNKPESKCRDRSPMKGSTAPKTYTKFSISINQIFHDLKDKLWFKLPPPIRREPSKMDQAKYCAFHRDLEHIVNYCTTWMLYQSPASSSKMLRELTFPTTTPC
ncbi:uncharacterized protein [Malus domestica]|uniref:uncharacterized protein n=1 Tax=Malus domestica TaxID=3750 RepID=UPI003976C2F3